MTDIISLFDPQIILIIILGLIAGTETILILRVGNIARAYARMTVKRTRIQADGKITLDDPDIIPFVQETFAFMTELENVFHYITGYILNHPSTGWIKGYATQLNSVGEVILKELSREEVTDVTLQSNPGQQTVPPPEQPAQPVSPPAGA